MELFNNQNYEVLKNRSVQMGVPFTDPQFPPDTTSIGHTKDLPQDIQWKRPHVSWSCQRLY